MIRQSKELLNSITTTAETLDRDIFNYLPARGNHFNFHGGHFDGPPRRVYKKDGGFRAEWHPSAYYHDFKDIRIIGEGDDEVVYNATAPVFSLEYVEDGKLHQEVNDGPNPSEWKFEIEIKERTEKILSVEAWWRTWFTDKFEGEVGIGVAKGKRTTEVGAEAGGSVKAGSLDIQETNEKKTLKFTIPPYSRATYLETTEKGKIFQSTSMTGLLDATVGFYSKNNTKHSWNSIDQLIRAATAEEKLNGWANDEFWNNPVQHISASLNDSRRITLTQDLIFNDAARFSGHFKTTKLEGHEDG